MSSKPIHNVVPSTTKEAIIATRRTGIGAQILNRTVDIGVGIIIESVLPTKAEVMHFVMQASENIYAWVHAAMATL